METSICKGCGKPFIYLNKHFSQPIGQKCRESYTKIERTEISRNLYNKKLHRRKLNYGPLQRKKRHERYLASKNFPKNSLTNQSNHILAHESSNHTKSNFKAILRQQYLHSKNHIIDQLSQTTKNKNQAYIFNLKTHIRCLLTRLRNRINNSKLTDFEAIKADISKIEKQLTDHTAQMNYWSSTVIN